MLLRQFRLKNKYAFSATYHVKHSFHIQGVTIFVGREKKSDFPTKVGFVVSKKTHKRAVKRNRLKRLIREAYRVLQKENNLFGSQKYISIIFIGHQNALGKNFVQIKKIVCNLLQRIN